MNFDARGEIFWSANGNPRRKVYLDESPGIGVQDIWMDFRDAHNQNICVTGYPTEKNPDLVKRVIEALSEPRRSSSRLLFGFGHLAGRCRQPQPELIGIDNSPEAIRTTLQRFATGTQPMGSFVVQRRMEWQAAGNSRKTPEPSLFGEPEDQDEPQPPAGGHSAIRDFVVVSEKRVASRIAETIQVWRDRWTQELASLGRLGGKGGPGRPIGRKRIQRRMGQNPYLDLDTPD